MASRNGLDKWFKQDWVDIGSKKKGMKGDLSQIQFEDAVRGKEDILIKKVKEGKDSLKKIADAAADDKQLTKSLEKFERDLFRGGGRAGYKAGSKGCKLAMKGKGRAYGKNS